MIQKRLNLFETNSSSTHSISIHRKLKEDVTEDIPRNSQSIFKIPEYKEANGGEIDTVCNILMSELYKTSFMLNVIATYISNIADDLDYDSEIIQLFSNLCNGKVIDLTDKKQIKSAIANDLIYTKWVKEVVYEETGTNIEFDISTEIYDYFPYISTIYMESKSPIDEFYEDLYTALNNNYEYRFKSLCREIIFNKEIIIEDFDEAYSNTFNKNIL